jgi:hypothetical protein
MSVVTVTNSSATSPGGSVTLNALRVYNGATGGTVQVALPYPFNADAGSAVPVIPAIYGPVAPGASLTLGMHEDDFHYKRVPWETTFPRTDWNFLIDAGIVTMAFAAQTETVVAPEATTIASGSNGLSLPQTSISVASTSGFPSAGIIAVTTSLGVQSVTYTGTSGGNTFTGTTGGTGTMTTGGAVVNYGHGIGAEGDIEDLFIHDL